MDTTVIIVSYKSEHLIEKNLQIFDEKTKIIIIDNSQNIDLKNNIENKFKNVKVVLNLNKGFGQAANLGAKLANTRYILFCSPDNYIEKNTINNLENISSGLSYKFGALILTEKNNFISERTMINSACGAPCFFIKRETFFSISGFDENFFLYYEDTDFIKRLLKEKNKIYKVTERYSSQGGSHNNLYNYPIEINRNWHFMWSTFYYKRKHWGYVYSLIATFPHFMKSLIKMVIYFRIQKKKEIYFARFSGLFNSYILKESWYRPRI